MAYVAAHGKVLLNRLGSYSLDGEFDSGNESYLLDPETGTVQPVKGEFRPLSSPLSRAPQSAEAPNLFWAAIYDVEEEAGPKFGRYDSKNFTFTPLLKFPGLYLRDDDIWVDAAGGKIWFVYRGHLLRLSLPKKTECGQRRPKKTGGDLRQTNQFAQCLWSGINTAGAALSHRPGGTSCEAISILLT